MAGIDRDLRSAIHRRLLAADGADALVHATPEELRTRIGGLVDLERPLLALEDRARLVAAVLDDVVGLGALEPLLLDPTIDEIMVNGPDRCFVERAGCLERVPLHLDEAGILRVVDRILAPLALRLDRSSPMVDARLPDGSRLHAVIPPLAIDGPCLTIRRFGKQRLGLEDFGADAVAERVVGGLVHAGVNIVISGGTGSGKTTLLNALAGYIAPSDRVVTIEETAELQLPQPHVVRLEARPANAEGSGAVSVRDLVRAALRMRPDRLVVGEVRGAEALDLLQALNTGHDGSVSTVHANAPLDALRRLATLALFGGTGLPHEAICDQIRSSVDVVIQVERAAGGALADRRGGRGGGPAGPVRRRATTASHRTGLGGDASAGSRPHLAGPMIVLMVVMGVGVAWRLGRAASRVDARVRARGLQVARRHLPTRLRTPIESALRRGAVALAPEDALRWWLGGVGGLVWFSWVVVPPLALPVGIVGVLAGPVWLRLRAGRADQAAGQALPAALDHVIAQLRAGGTVVDGVLGLADGSGALANDFRRIRNRLELGTAIGQSLAEWGAERPLPSVRAVAGALTLVSEVGGTAVQPLEGLACSLRDDEAVAAEAYSATAQARMSALVVGGAPIAYLGFSTMTDPESARVLVGTTIGRVCLVTGLGLETLAGWWMYRLVGARR